MRHFFLTAFFWFAYGIVYSLSLLPFWVWYRISDVLYVIVFHLIGYRKKVVYQNLKRVFPEYSDSHIHTIAKKFYSHFCDWLIEIIKGFSMSDNELAKRVRLITEGVPEEVIEGKKGTLMVGTHYGNNEWLLARLDLMINRRYNAYAVYSSISNKVLEKMIFKARGRRGVQFVPMRKAMVQAVRKMKETCMFGFLTDQAPHRGQRQYFTLFLNQPTSWHTSVSKIALRTQSIVYLGDMRKVKRGYYTLKLIKLDPTPYLPETQESIIAFTNAQIAMLEQAIKDEPAYWLWSHRRWKIKPRPNDYLSPGIETMIE
ncbi:MAG: lysophospholipid acyltransferase family protein [Bacteroidetes bacterium]|nr:lysophospholipid acyltransferase family protein [Bacteroidota bacterium]